MKVKHTIIPFIPVALAMIGLKLMSLFGLDSNGLFMGMNFMNIAYVVIGLTLALFVICILMNIIDRKTAPVCKVSRNPIAGVFAVLAGASVIVASLVKVVSTTENTEYYIMTIICGLLSIPAGVALAFMSKVHFTGETSASGISFLYIFPSIWGCAELVNEFLNATKISISATDMTTLFCYIFLTLYLFSHSMIISRIKGRNPVKACFIYGFPAVAVTLAYGAYAVCTGATGSADTTALLEGVQFVLLGIYALTFLVEMTRSTMAKDEVEIIDGIPDDEDAYENSYIKSEDYDSLVYSETNPNDGKDIDADYVPASEQMGDFVMGFDSPDEEDEPVPYLTKEEMKSAEPFNGVFISSDYNKKAEQKAEEPAKPASDVDQLLQELENKK